MKRQKKILLGNVMPLILIFMSLGVITPANAVSSTNMKLEIEWEVLFGEPGDDELRGFIQTSDGGFAVVTYQEDTGSSLVKFTANGVQEWNITFIENPMYGKALVQTADDGYVVVGRVGVWGQDCDVFLLKFNSTGISEWNSTFGGANTDWINSFFPTDDGGFVLAGGFDFSDASPDDYDMWLVKTDSQGIPEWNYTYGGNMEDLAAKVIQTADGGYALAGRTNSYSLDTHDAWLVKTDANGQPEWNKTYDCEMAWAMDQNLDGSYILAGRTPHSVDTGEDYYLLKADSNGNQVWYHEYDNLHTDQFNCLIQSNEGGYLLAGGTGAPVAITGNDLWLIKTDANGVPEWNVTHSRSGDQSLRSVIQLSDGSLVIAGTDGSDAWLFKAQVVEDTITATTTTASGFELSLVLLCLTLIILFTRKRRL